MEIEPREYRCRLLAKSQLTQNTYLYQFQVEEPSGFTFVPGQYATFIIDPQTRRQYTFASAPNGNTFELVVDISPGGPGSRFFLNLKEGDRAQMLSPLGDFTFSDNQLKKIFVATGTGVAPFRAMIRAMLQRDKGIKGQMEEKKKQALSHCNFVTLSLSLYWGLRYEDDVYWESEFQAIASQYRGFQFYLTLSKPSPQWKGMTGHVIQHVFENSSFAKASADREKNLQNCEFYLCGNRAMIDEMETRLLAQNVQKERIKKDIFY